jgi:hypothetical protein
MKPMNTVYQYVYNTKKTGALGTQPVMYSAIQHGPILHPSTPLKPGT